MGHFTASRLSSGNKLFPPSVSTEKNGITIKFPGFFSGQKTVVDYKDISSISYDAPMIGFTKLNINIRGKLITVEGFYKGDCQAIINAWSSGRNRENEEKKREREKERREGEIERREREREKEKEKEKKHKEKEKEREEREKEREREREKEERERNKRERKIEIDSPLERVRKRKITEEEMWVEEAIEKEEVWTKESAEREKTWAKRIVEEIRVSLEEEEEEEEEEESDAPNTPENDLLPMLTNIAKEKWELEKVKMLEKLRRVLGIGGGRPSQVMDIMNKEYYYLDCSNEQRGPLDIEKLKSVELKPDTWVWTEGFKDWKTLKEVEELQILLKMPPPPSSTPTEFEIRQ